MRSTFKILMYLKKGSEKPDGNVQDAKLQIFKEQDNPVRFRLSLNGQNIIDWFRQKYKEVKQIIRPHIKPPAKPEVGKNKGFKI